MEKRALFNINYLFSFRIFIAELTLNDKPSFRFFSKVHSA